MNDLAYQLKLTGEIKASRYRAKAPLQCVGVRALAVID
jgi:hypothetical protein